MADPRVEIWNRTNTTKLGDVAEPLACKYREIMGEVGEGTLVMPYDDPAVAHLIPYNVVRLIDDNNVVVGAFIMTKMVNTPVQDGEESGAAWTITGPGMLARWTEAVVAPWLPEGEKPTSDVRMFNFASPPLPMPGAVWQRVYLATRPNATWEEGRNLPMGHPTWYSTWIWSRAAVSNQPPGDSYFRRSFTVPATGTYVFFTSADRAEEVWIDGVQVYSTQVTADRRAWLTDGTFALELSTGRTHWVAIKGSSAGGEAGVLMEAWSIGEVNEGLVTPLLVTGYDPTFPPNPAIGIWMCADYPAIVPGFTAGCIIRILLEEAQARGALPSMTLNFTDVVDSAGTAWPVISEFGAKVGDDYLKVLKDLQATHVDLRAHTIDSRLSAWVKGGQGIATSSALTVGGNLTEYTVTIEG